MPEKQISASAAGLSHLAAIPINAGPMTTQFGSGILPRQCWCGGRGESVGAPALSGGELVCPGSGWRGPAAEAWCLASACLGGGAWQLGYPPPFSWLEAPAVADCPSANRRHRDDRAAITATTPLYKAILCRPLSAACGAGAARSQAGSQAAATCPNPSECLD